MLETGLWAFIFRLGTDTESLLEVGSGEMNSSPTSIRANDVVTFSRLNTDQVVYSQRVVRQLLI